MTYLPKPGQLVLDEHGREVGRAVEVRRKTGVVVMDPERNIPMRDFYTGKFRPDRSTPPDVAEAVTAATEELNWLIE